MPPVNDACRETGKRSTREDQLDQVLKVVLGQTDKPALDISLSTACLQAAAEASTLQDRVFIRAEGVFDARNTVLLEPLQKELENDLEPMRIKRARTKDNKENPDRSTELGNIVSSAWTVLGKPKLVSATADGKVTVSISPAEIPPDGLAIEGLNTQEGSQLRRLLGEYYLRFDSFDQISYPLYYGTNTGEPATVEVVRVSPQDATHLVNEQASRKKKLAGTALANFGAFLDRSWRQNDIMWGRLDGAERLIQVLLPMQDADSAKIRKELIELAHQSILRETLTPAGHGALTQLMCAALQELPSNASDVKNGQQPSLKARLDELLKELNLGDGAAQNRLQDMLVSLLDGPQLAKHVRDDRTLNPNPDTKTTFDSVTRAVTITGRLLQGISAQRGSTSSAARWLARLGLLLQGIVAVSMPRSLTNRWAHDALKVLYAFELSGLALGLLFGGTETSLVFLSALGVTAILHLVMIWLRDRMQNRYK